MAATVTHISSATRPSRRSGHIVGSPPPTPGLAAGLPSRVHFWRGASGYRHLCAVYSLLDCPPMPKAIYLLVRRDRDGRREILSVGAAEHEHRPLNLAQIRQAGATIGANEVHVSFASANASARRAAATDIANAYAMCA